jgi:predicted metalloendopeptidase
MRAPLCLVAAGVLLFTQATPPKSGLDLASFDRSVRPQDDLYRFVNGRWLDTTAIPADRVTYGTFTELADRAEMDVRRIIEGLRGGGSEQQIRDLYASMLDEAHIEALGVAPIQPELDRIAAIDSAPALARRIGHLSAINAGGPFGASAALAGNEPGSIVVTVSQGGTLLPERDYYFKSDAATRAIRERYVAYLTRIFTMTGWRTPETAAGAVFELETTLARAQQPHAESRIRPPRRPMTLREAEREMPGFSWSEWAKPQGLDHATAIVFEQPDFFRTFAATAATVPLDVWKSWLAARYITASSIYVSNALADARFEFFGRVLSGQEAPRERWKRGVSLVNAYLADAMGQLYVREHFPDSSRQRVRNIVRTILDAFRDAVRDASWMTGDARGEALKKLEFLQSGIGYPDRWRSYEGLRISRDDLLGNVQRAQKFENDYRVMRLRRRFEPRQWLMPPQTVNAYYTPSRNEIILPAAMLQPPLFDAAADDAVNYGGIGAIIGHEIGHAFDQRGRRFDAFGRVRDWWSAKDEERFQQRARELVKQFGQYEPLPGQFVNGELTLGENIGDLGGLAVAVRAYRLSLRGKPAPVIDGFTGEQRLFLRWAQIWRERTRDEYLRQTLFLNQHAPPQFRGNGAVVNLDAFHDAFGVKAGDRLYRDPARRIKIW